MKESKTVHRRWHLWELEKVQDWLAEEEASGWHLTGVNQSVKRFEFRRSVPRKVVYALDYRPFIFKGKKRNEYKQLAEDSNWELVHEPNLVAWYLWRKSYADRPPSFYSDPESNWRHIRFMMIVNIIPVIAIALFIVSELADKLSFYKSWLHILIGGAILFNFFYNSYALFRLGQIKNKIQEKQI
jgi:hypothetical protein